MTTGAALAPLSAAAGFDLAVFRQTHVSERVRRAFAREGVGDEHELSRLLSRDPAARARFRRSVAISVSGLFRDRSQFDFLDRELLPALLEGGRPLTAWSAGCADGSELASVAELLARRGALGRARLLGSDLLEENIEAARRARLDVLRPGNVRWEQRDLVLDGPPPGEWRLVVCRNVAIYLTPEARSRLHSTLLAALAPGGVLLLGRSERLARPLDAGLEIAGPHAYRRVA